MKISLMIVALSMVLLSACVRSRSSATVQSDSTSSSFATPNVLDNASFEGSWDAFTNWSAGTPIGVSLDNTLAYQGSWSVKRVWSCDSTCVAAGGTSADGGAQLVYPFGSLFGQVDRIWLRFYFKLTAPISSIMKFARFYDSTFTYNFGGFFLGQGSYIFSWGWDQEDSAITDAIGLTESQVIDGNWHSLEVDYWRNGDPSGYPSAAFWFDGQPQALPDGTPTHYYGAGNNSYWKGGRLYAGERASSVKLGLQEWLATLNAGNTTTGQCNVDLISYSTQGRIGP